jgi:peptidyl-tRNA hydrolase, PTH1 family
MAMGNSPPASSGYVIAGLGNPGPRYDGTRHNVGFWLLDALAREHGCAWSMKSEFEAEVARFERGGRRILLAKPQTYVNLSGRSVGAICRYFRIPPATALVVVYDEINIDAGRLKISLKGSAGGHNGIADIIQHLGNEFIRFRVGIGPRHPPAIDLKDFVLGKFSEEQAALLQSQEREFLEAIHLLIDSGPNPAMNRVNQKNRKQDEPNQSKLPRDLHSRHEGQDGVGGGSDRAVEKGG